MKKIFLVLVMVLFMASLSVVYAQKKTPKNVVINSKNIKVLDSLGEFSGLDDAESLALLKKKYGIKSMDEFNLLGMKVYIVCALLEKTTDNKEIITEFSNIVELEFGPDLAKVITLNKSEIKAAKGFCPKNN